MLALAVKFAIESGMRLGEMLALTWRNVDQRIGSNRAEIGPAAAGSSRQRCGPESILFIYRHASSVNVKKLPLEA